MDITDVKRDVSYNLNHEGEKTTWPSGLVTLSIILLVLAVITTVGLKIWNNSQIAKLDSLKQETEKLKNSFAGGEQEIITTEKTLNNIAGILKDHSNTSKLMTLIEQNTDPTVTFTTLNWDPNTLILSLDGTAGSYTKISQQVLNFQQAVIDNSNQLAFNKVIMKGAKSVSAGNYSFSLEVDVNKAVLNF